MSPELRAQAAWPLTVAAALPLLAYRGWRRLQLSRAKHRSLAGHSLWSKRLARLVPGYSHSATEWMAVDGAPEPVLHQRRTGLARLSAVLQGRSPKTLAHTAALKEGLSDLQFTSRYRVPFAFTDAVQTQLPLGAVWAQADGLHLTDLDGQRHWDLTGSYGVNLFGVDFYKSCMAEGLALGNALGPVLGGYHPCVLDNVRRLRQLSGMDEVSFHMSGTEAVMQAVRLARYHTGKRHVVRFAGAYHGWWEDVQPGPGNPLPPRDTYTLADQSERALAVLDSRCDIACVLVNPLQALHPNRNAPADGTLTHGQRHSAFDRQATTAWLQRLREVCTRRGIALIFDEVFMGFRLGPGGAQAHFGVQADLVTYGKTVAGGLPVGVVCGRAKWMRRFRTDRPADVCLARGTFNAHPAVMGAMQVFLQRLDTPAVQAMYDGADERWQAHCARFNAALAAAGLPLQAAAMGTVWTLNLLQPSRYHWMLQFYLREAGVALSWVGTGRFIFTLAHTADDVDRIAQCVVAAATRMQADGWWWTPPGAPNRLGRQVLLETLRARMGWAP
jgi:glutamate-1-semialdehyde 2,1-aminomutase